MPSNPVSAREANYLDANNIIEDDVRDEALARAAARRDEISASQTPFVGTVNEAVPRFHSHLENNTVTTISEKCV